MRAKHGMSPGMSGCTESHYGEEKRERGDGEREGERVERKKWDERATNERFPCEPHKSADYEQHSSKPDSQAADQSLTILSHTQTHTHFLQPSLSMHKATVVTRQSPCTYTCVFIPSKAWKDVRMCVICKVSKRVMFKNREENVQHCTLSTEPENKNKKTSCSFPSMAQKLLP